MKTAILADIHANREALDACLADLLRRGCRQMVLLGDLVGYGADPVYCVDQAMRLAGAGMVVVQGNHDAAIAGDTRLMSGDAAACIAWTRGLLSPGQADFLTGLPLLVRAAGACFVHAEPKKPADWAYVSEAGQAGASLGAVRDRTIFCGHVHIPALYHLGEAGPATRFEPRRDVPVRLARARRWLVVLPSVGQPRDGVPLAGYGEWDSTSHSLIVRRVGYDVMAAANRLRQAPGLAPELGERLARRLLRGR